MVQFFVHDKDGKGDSGGTEKMFAVVADIDEQSPDLFKWYADTGLGKQFFHIRGRKLECEAERKWCFFPFDQLQAERSYF